MLTGTSAGTFANALPQDPDGTARATAVLDLVGKAGAHKIRRRAGDGRARRAFTGAPATRRTGDAGAAAGLAALVGPHPETRVGATPWGIAEERIPATDRPGRADRAQKTSDGKV